MSVLIPEYTIVPLEFVNWLKYGGTPLILTQLIFPKLSKHDGSWKTVLIIKLQLGWLIIILEFLVQLLASVTVKV